MGEEVEGLPQDQVMSKSMTGPQLQGSGVSQLLSPPWDCAHPSSPFSPLFPHLGESLPSSFKKLMKGDDFSLLEAKSCPSWLALIFLYPYIKGFTWLNF